MIHQVQRKRTAVCAFICGTSFLMIISFAAFLFLAKEKSHVKFETFHVQPVAMKAPMGMAVVQIEKVNEVIEKVETKKDSKIENKVEKQEESDHESDATDSEKFWAFSSKAKLELKTKRRAKLRGVFANYQKIHTDAIKNGGKVINVTPQGQLANRIRVMAAAIVIGILTDRAVIVQRGSYYAETSDIFDFQVDISNDKLRSSDTARDINIDSALCIDWLNVGDKVIGYRGVTALTPLVYLNPHLHEKFVNVFGTFEGVFQAVISYFFYPSKTVRNMFNEFRMSMTTTYPDAFFVGLHIRSGGDFRDGVMPPADWERFRDCAVASAEHSNKEDGHKKKVVFFVATDLAKSRLIAKSTFESKVDAVYFYKEFLISNNPSGVQAAFVDLLLVTSCDARVGTPGSSYSEFAFSVAGRSQTSSFVQSTVSNMPKTQFSTNLNFLPKYCLTPASTEPSMIELEGYVSKSVCFAEIKTKTEKWMLFRDPVLY